MNIRVLVRSLFAIWAMAVAAFSIISHPGSKDLLMVVKLTSSGFVMHCIAYFVGMLLCFLAFDAKNISFVVWAGLFIFLYSVVLEVFQFYLPCRTFNVYDVVANGIGIGIFCLISFAWTYYYRMNSHTGMDDCLQASLCELRPDRSARMIRFANGMIGMTPFRRDD